MSSQMEESQSTERGYGAYQGQSYTPPQYEEPYHRPTPDSGIDDNLVEAISQRIVQRINQGVGGKLQQPAPQQRQRLTPEQRTGLAIVSVAIIGILGIVLGSQGWFGLLAFGITSFVIFMINAVTSN